MKTQIPIVTWSLDRDPEGMFDESDLCANVPAWGAADLAFAQHVQRFIPGQRPISGRERAKTQAWFDHPFDESMILFHEIVEIFDGP